jgi:hypothetical protein
MEGSLLPSLPSGNEPSTDGASDDDFDFNALQALGP